MRCSFGRGFVAERAGLEFGKYYDGSLETRQLKQHDQAIQTAQAINGPLFELLKRDLGSGRNLVEIESKAIIELFVGGVGELFLLVVERGASLWINASVLLTNHDAGGGSSNQDGGAGGPLKGGDVGAYAL